MRTRYSQDVIVGRRVKILVQVIVARARHHDRAIGVGGSIDRIPERVRIGGTPQRQVDNFCAFLSRIQDPCRNIGVVGCTGGHDLDRHDLAARANPDDACTIVAHRSGHPRHQRAMPILIRDVIAAIHIIPTTNIIDQTIIVIVLPIGCNFTRVDPQVGGQVRMGKIDPGINNRDNGAACSHALCPGSFHIDLGQAPLFGIQRVINGNSLS